MSNTIIQVANIGKLYKLGEVGTGTISHDLHRWWARFRGKEDPFLKVGEVNDRTRSGGEYVWALQDVGFEVRQGEVIGIIGRNGAGKSTLLKILSRVTKPTTGHVKIKGKIASLLEVGTGFHPELTGRENIYLNGAILGMRKAEIKRKFDEIVDFSGVERYIDTPVKRYSSGMYVRLAFAVAAYLEPEILIVDEVLAVGDSEFQKKCLGRMKDVSVNDGRTVLFVSHNMAAVKELCSRTVYLKNGIVKEIGETNAIVKQYLQNPVTIGSEIDLINDFRSRRGYGEVRFTEIKINDGELEMNPQKEIRIHLKAKVLQAVDKIYFEVMVRGPENSEPLTTSEMFCINKGCLKKGDCVSFTVNIQANTFRTGLFPLCFWLGKRKEIAGDHYPYDVVDSVYYLNLATDKTEEELGYNSVQPSGYFNFKAGISNINMGANVL